MQGALELMYELERWLAEIAGLHVATLQPAAGAHGELTGLLVIRAAHLAEGRDPKRIIIPDTAHGTNPASVVMAGFEPAPVAQRRARRRGHRRRCARSSTRATSPASCSPTPTRWALFDEHIAEIARLVHEAGGLLYYDGANANAVLGVSRPGDMGFDIVHFNTHKTFSTPHGGGGPGAGPIVVRDSLAPFLPVPLVEKDEDGRFFFQYDRPQSIGKVRTFYGNFGVLVRAWTYIRGLGAGGPARGQRDGRAQRQLRDGGRARPARPALRRPALHARVRGLGDAAQAGRRARPRRGQAPARLRRAPADHVLPAHRRRGAHGRADGDGVQGRARPPGRGVPQRGARGRGRSRSCCARRR